MGHTHADPRKYKHDDVLNLGIAGWKIMTAGEIWDKDLNKKNYAEFYGFETLAVWEIDLD